jgi:predicted small integral membrane protein
MSMSPRAGGTALRLSPGFRIGLYAAFAALCVSGAGWLLADWLKNGAGDDVWQESAAYLLMLHGGSAMAILMLLGALAPLHVQRAWRSRRNRATGIAMVTFNVMLIVTAFGLYYLGSETLRSWASDLHIGIGIGLPALLVGHVVAGRRRSRPDGR